MRPSGRLRRWAIRLIAGLLVVIVCAAIALAVWAKTGLMEVEPRLLRAVLSEPGVSVVEDADAMVLRPDAEADSLPGLVFYPGAKVEAGAYAARLASTAVDTGTTVVSVKRWLGLALFDPHGLTAFTGHAPEVETWMVGGHSTSQKIAENRGRLPASARMVEIPGAGHSSFGDYGPQSGDGSPSIDDEQMDAAVTEELTEFARSITGG